MIKPGFCKECGHDPHAIFRVRQEARANAIIYQYMRTINELKDWRNNLNTEADKDFRNHLTTIIEVLEENE
jgi:hypothetical protein